MFGFLLGMTAMYWYVHRGSATLESVERWFQSSGSKYSGRETHEAARELLDHSSR